MAAYHVGGDADGFCDHIKSFPKVSCDALDRVELFFERGKVIGSLSHACQCN
jgi:hypothetical protein